MTTPTASDNAALPSPETVWTDANEHGQGTNAGDRLADPSVINVVVAGTAERVVDEITTQRQENSGYHGPNAGVLGRLAAAVETIEETSPAYLHCPEPIGTAAGPWLVLEPHRGRIATVSTGRGQARITIEAEQITDGDRLVTTNEAINAVLEAARPRHDHYPVRSDDHGVFTTGMTTFELESVERGGPLEVYLMVWTTPATTGSEVETRFETNPVVTTCEYEPIVGVERARPTDQFRKIIETVHRDVIGDTVYEWLPRPTVFSRLPTARKMAIGTGDRNATTFDSDAFDRCRRLLANTLAYWEATQ